MNDIRLSFLRALASTTKFDFLRESSSGPVEAYWLVIIRALLGLAYALCAALLCWLLHASSLLAALLGTAAILLLHQFLTNAPEASFPVKFRQALFPGENPTGDLLANLALPGMLFLTILEGDIFWLPGILALGAAMGVDFVKGNGQQSGKLLQDGKCWGAAAVVTLIFAWLPALGSSDAQRAVLLRGIFLFAGMLIVKQWLRNTRLKTSSLRANCFLGTLLAFLLALIANAL